MLTSKKSLPEEAYQFAVKQTIEPEKMSPNSTRHQKKLFSALTNCHLHVNFVFNIICSWLNTYFLIWIVLFVYISDFHFVETIILQNLTKLFFVICLSNLSDALLDHPLSTDNLEHVLEPLVILLDRAVVLASCIDEDQRLASWGDGFCSFNQIEQSAFLKLRDLNLVQKHNELGLIF